MSRLPDYTNVSVALSEVLADVGLNEKIVNERRRTHIVMETLGTVSWSMIGSSNRVYIFGSQSEGTTTRGLDSDFDTLRCICNTNVIQARSDWKQGVRNLLMVESEATPPGYCMLQLLKPDIPVPETEIIDEQLIYEHCFRDRLGRIFLKNTLHMSMIYDFQEQHGPAFSIQAGNGKAAMDNVHAFPCTSQLSVVQHWLSQLHGRWPSENMKQNIARCPCFVVPVGSRGSVYETLEWRISTSFAERCLIFSLNVTQLQVYVLMKMLLKTSINYNVPKESHISSFMCKTVVLHCIQNTDPNAWHSHMLVQFLLFSLFTLYSCVVNENCPHFIIRLNNLMAGRFTQQAKYQLQQNLRWLLGDIISRGIISLNIDGVAGRLKLKLNALVLGIRYRDNDEECQAICCSLRLRCAGHTQHGVHVVLRMLTENRFSGPTCITLLQQSVQCLEHVYMDGNTIERSACRLLRPYFHTTLGSLIASESIQNSGIIRPQAFAFFSRGLNSDVASSRLKLASVFFCAGDMEKTEITLKDLEGRYDTSVCTPVCWCKAVTWLLIPTRSEALTLTSDESDIPKITSSCVFFTRGEKNCIPQELQYEMYRSTRQELLHSRDVFDYWMNWAVVDCLPYFHFLCYKFFRRLERRADQQSALYNLELVIQTEPNLNHKETALNLLGQCMEQENRWNYALQCYRLSLNICPRNNAAKSHVGRLLYMRYRQCHA